MKNWLLDLLAELAITAAIAVIGLLIHAIDWALRFALGPQTAPIAWVVILFAALITLVKLFSRAATIRKRIDAENRQLPRYNHHSAA